MNGARRTLALALVPLAAGLVGLELDSLLAAACLALVLLTGLRLLEARRRRALRGVALLELLAAGVQAGLRPDLGMALLQLVATVLALTGLLAVELGAGHPLRQLLRRSLALLGAALPAALLLLLLLPRLPPFGAMQPGESGRGQVGLAESLEPGSIDRLAGNPAPAARVRFADAPPAPAERYWRVLVHSDFDGQRWRPGPGGNPPPPGRVDGGTMDPATGRQFWLVEPGELETVPWDGLGQPLGNDLRAGLQGELLHRQPPERRRTYALAAAAAPAWRQRPPQTIDLSLPPGSQPRLEALAAGWRRLPRPDQRLAAAERWFRGQPFRYSSTPGRLPRRAGLDAFLFDRQVGFCGHYASAFTALMRAAGVPARVVSGYQGGSWVAPLGGEPFLDLRQGDAHAWSEVWLPRRGWQRVDPSTWSVDAGSGADRWAAQSRGSGPLLWLQRQWWALDLGWSETWLNFDRDRQEELLQRLLGDRRRWLGLLLLATVGVALAAGLALLGGGRATGAGIDPLERELRRVVKALARLGLEPLPGESLAQLLGRAGRQRPDLEPLLTAYGEAHLSGRFGALTQTPAELRTAARALRRRCASEARAIRRPRGRHPSPG